MGKSQYLFQGLVRKKGEKVWMSGKPVDSKWVEGIGVAVGSGDFSIIYTANPATKWTVYTDSVREFTGKVDEDGRKIFEGDIVRFRRGEYALVEYDEEMAMFTIKGVPAEVEKDLPLGAYNGGYSFKVVGNKWDDPELLKEIHNEDT